MSIAEKFRLLCPAAEDVTIGEQSFKFYQCSPKTLASTAQLVARLAGSISMLFADNATDVGHTIQDFEAPDGETGQTTVVNAITESLAAARANRKREAIEDLVVGLLADEHRKSLLGLLVNSLRDEFDRRDQAAQAEAIDMFDDMDLGPFIEFFMGLMKANGKVFGDLGKQITDRVQEQMGGAVESEAQETVG